VDAVMRVCVLENNVTNLLLLLQFVLVIPLDASHSFEGRLRVPVMLLLKKSPW
jgi:hypothetical protein